MAKKNPGDVLTCDWNPVIGCERYSEGCQGCWYLDGIFPWQQRLGNIPESVHPNQHYVFNERMTVESLKKKTGIVGIVQHGDLFWDAVPDSVIKQVLSIIDSTAHIKKNQPKYVLWTKRAERAATILNHRYPSGLPNYLALSVSMENQRAVEERMPHLLSVEGMRIAMFEPLLSSVDLTHYNPPSWIVVGSETGSSARPINLDWVRGIRDYATTHRIPFFIKQLGSSHKVSVRELDGREWNQFPIGYTK